jgi:hypothetical protein
LNVLYIFSFLVLGFGLWALYMLGKHSTTGLNIAALDSFSFVKLFIISNPLQ